MNVEGVNFGGQVFVSKQGEAIHLSIASLQGVYV